MAKSRPRVLIADNDFRRRKAIRTRIGARGVIEEADSAESAAKALLHAPRAYAYVFLDHDFGFGAAWTGVDLARLISLLPYSKMPKNVLIHAESPVAANQMLRILEAAGIEARRVSA